MNRLRPARAHLFIAAPVVILALVLFLRRSDPDDPAKKSSGSTSTAGPAFEGADPAGAPLESIRRTQDLDPFLAGNPKVVHEILDRLDRPDQSPAERNKTFEELQKQLERLVVSHGVHTLPLIGRILCEPAYPRALREAALNAIAPYPNPQTTDFLGRLVASGKVAPDMMAESLSTFSNLVERLHALHRTQPLMTLCKQIYEGAILSTDESVRIAALVNYVLLAQPENPQLGIQTLLAAFRSDPSTEVRAAAAGVLARTPDYVKDNESLANEMKSVAVGNGPEAERILALDILVATQTATAGAVVLACLADPSSRVKGVAILCAGKLKLAESVPILAQLLADARSPDAKLRSSYVLPALLQIPGRESTRAILACATSDPDVNLRQKALSLLPDSPGLRDEQLARELVALFHAQRDPVAKGDVAAILARNPSPDAYDALRKSYLATADESRYRIASVLLGSPHAGTFVQSTFAELVKTPLGSNAVEQLVKSAPDRALIEIQDLYVSRQGTGLDEETKRSAIRSLGTLGTQQAGRLLKQIMEIEEERDRDMWAEARSALKRIETGN